MNEVAKEIDLEVLDFLYRGYWDSLTALDIRLELLQGGVDIPIDTIIEWSKSRGVVLNEYAQ